MHVVSMDVEVTAVIKKIENIQVEQLRDLARDSGQRKLTHSLQNHCASSRSVYLSRRLDSHRDKFAVTHHLKVVGVFSTEII